MNKNQFNEISYSCTNIANASHCTGAIGIATVSKYLQVYLFVKNCAVW